MRKMHLRVGKAFVAQCSQGNRANNGGMVVSPQEYKELPDTDRCKACESLYLTRRNIQRQKKGLTKVKTWNEGFDEK